ncbi:MULTISPECIES: hypothetical protein [unclassified Streptomyces]|uniref:hypothetical protein n=1 Tax=unclassified Streptomyces TaxID=2593676 RepID=UPI00070DFB89|nr:MULTISPECIES: hypothetical protein [unclassified Streptomyces]KRA79869.1 hypothetical protein ASE09_17040 [Streptomyces sp. Root66D1]
MNTDMLGPQTLIEDVPAFAAHTRQAVLLRPTAGHPGPHDSSVGGPLLWPEDEPWPVCRAPHVVHKREKLSDEDKETWQECDRRMKERRRARGGGAYVMSEEDVAAQRRIMDGAGSLDLVTWERIRTVGEVPAVPVPMVPVLQLRAGDVPGLPVPEGTDLLQLLWCPDDHAEPPGQPRYWGPNVELRYRAAGSVGPILGDPPRPEHAEAIYVPNPCVLDPFPVVDLPEEDELPEDLVDTAHEWAEARDTEYARTFACLPGWKAGGWPSWHLTDLVRIDCAACGTRMRLLLTLDSGTDPGLNLGRFGELRVFTCPTDLSHPFRLNVQ